MSRRRIPLLSGILSLAFAGLGQLYNGQMVKGVVFLVAEGVTLYLRAYLVTAVICILAAIDAYNTADMLSSPVFYADRSGRVELMDMDTLLKTKKKK